MADTRTREQRRRIMQAVRGKDPAGPRLFDLCRQHWPIGTPDSRLAPAGAFAILPVATRDIEGRQPILAPDHPDLVGRLHQVRRIEAADMDLDLIAAAAEQGRTAGRAEMAVLVLRR